MLAAIARAAGVPSTTVQRAVMLAGFAGPVAQAALTGGAEPSLRVTLEVGRPLRPMLAASAPGIADIVTGEQEVILERKIDGIRIQAHKRGDEVRLFTRSLDEITDRLPEVVDVVAGLPARSAVLDGETVALRPMAGPNPSRSRGRGPRRAPTWLDCAPRRR